MATLQNSKIKLRELEPEDIDFLYNTENNISLWEISNTSKPFSKHILNEYIKNSNKDIFTTKQIRFIIETIKERNIVGIIDLFDYDPIHLRAGIGIIINNSERRKNYASDAIEIIKHYTYNTLRLNQLYCEISSDNKASISLFEKSNFKLSGTKKQWINTADGFKDVLFYQFFF